MEIEQEGIRINKYLASTGYCSRRQADEIIAKGRVTVDDVTCEMGTRVSEGQLVKVDNKAVFPKDERIYIALYKPLGITCTTDRRDPHNIIDFLNFPQRIFPIGRLDKNSSGLILLTNDGDIVNRLLRAENGHEKEYMVVVNKPIDSSFVEKMSNGLPILDTTTLPCVVEQTGSRSFKIILTQGLNRQIRRMCEYLDYKVVKLRRVRFMNITLGNMSVGQFRHLSHKERTRLFDLIDYS